MFFTKYINTSNEILYKYFNFDYSQLYLETLDQTLVHKWPWEIRKSRQYKTKFSNSIRKFPSGHSFKGRDEMEERISIDKFRLYLSQMAFITFTEMHN